MQNAELAQHLILIEERLSAIEAALNPGALTIVAERLSSIDRALAARVPAYAIRAAIEDAFQTYGLVAQLKEVYTTQRDDLAVLVELAGSLLEEERAHDASGSQEREAINQLLTQLLELGRKHVSGLYDLERAVGWRKGDAERRKSG